MVIASTAGAMPPPPGRVSASAPVDMVASSAAAATIIFDVCTKSSIVGVIPLDALNVARNPKVQRQLSNRYVRQRTQSTERRGSSGSRSLHEIGAALKGNGWAVGLFAPFAQALALTLGA